MKSYFLLLSLGLYYCFNPILKNPASREISYVQARQQLSCRSAFKSALQANARRFSDTELLNLKKKYSIAISETGGGSAIRDQFDHYDYNDLPEHQSIVTYDRKSSDRWYGPRKDDPIYVDSQISYEQAKIIAQEEFKKLRSFGKKRIAIAQTLRTARDNQAYSWVSIKAQRENGLTEQLSIYVELSGVKAMQIKQMGIFNTNLIKLMMSNTPINPKSLQAVYSGIPYGFTGIRKVILNDTQWNTDQIISLIKNNDNTYLLINKVGQIILIRSLIPEIQEKIINSAEYRLMSFGASEKDIKDSLKKLLTHTRPLAQKIRDLARSKIDNIKVALKKKIHLINLDGRIKGQIIEVGPGKRLSSEILNAPFSGTIYESSQFKSIEDLLRRHQWPSNKTPEENLQFIVDQKFKEINISNDFVRKYSMVRNIIKVKNNHIGYFLIKAESKKLDGNNFYIKVKIKIKDLKKPDLIQFSANLLEEISYISKEGESLQRRLEDSLDLNNLQIEDVIKFDDEAEVYLNHYDDFYFYQYDTHQELQIAA